MEHVFISYVREDGKRVDRLQRRLQAAGITAWRDTSSLWPGQDWRIEIREAIERGVAFIACFSENTERRSSSYQNEELIFAVELMRRHPPGRVWLLPVRFADCRLPDFDLGLGRTLDSLQRVDLFHGPGWNAGITRLATAIHEVRGYSEAKNAPSPNRHSPSSDSSIRLIGRSLKRPARQRHGADVETDISISLGDATLGCVVPVTVSGNGSCLTCDGTGARSNADIEVCTACRGTGQASEGSTATYSQPCKRCTGRGLWVNVPCQQCSGSGRMAKSFRVQVHIPPGVRDGQRVKVADKGAPGVNGGPAGDLYLRVKVHS